MARPNKIPTDPKVYRKLLENWALGIPVRLIAESLGLNENTVKGWKRRKDFNRDLAVKMMEILAEPIKQVKETNPLTFLQTHPETREGFRPPKQESDVAMKIVVRDVLADRVTE